MKQDNISRRKFLGILGVGSTALAGSSLLSACKQKNEADANDEYKNQIEPPKDKMEYRVNKQNNDRVSLLGYGMMRLPTKAGTSARTQENDANEDIDQEEVNRLVDYALEHGVNYFDTSPAYCRGLSEKSTGIALSRYPRNKYYVATKMSNFAEETWTTEASKEMFENSLKELQVDYIDYYLLHAIGGGMEEFENRYINNGILDWLLEQRKAGRIRNLGFSFHGQKDVWDELLKLHDKYHWDFVQIQLNYLDWNFADEMASWNVDGSYLYDELQKREIPSVIMEPLLGGRLAKVPQFVARMMKKRRPERSVASWAFRYAGTPEGVLCVLSGMTYMEHLKDNLSSYCPFEPCSEEEKAFLENDIAKELFNMENIPCNDCKYCMPCPYGINIPAIFVHYNKCKNEGTLPMNPENEKYAVLRRNYLIGLDRSVPKLRQANHCIGCGQCTPHCPQKIQIPEELQKIDQFVEKLKLNGFERPKGKRL
uniref:Putative aldo/keto reductase family oxidoreductase n=1 Tax=uncultured bacterium fosmid pJB69A5 TaxID=1478067 RepID=A0A0H3U7Y7_9BACT|nr:putative aldo/keto reductase family oxidoreductase [uncultured bacterium fosmid pJB69A5]